jgi:hypothetical protein
VVAFVRVPAEDAQRACKVMLDLGNGDAVHCCNLDVAELIDTDAEKDLALHRRHVVDGAFGAVQPPPFQQRSPAPLPAICP